jgi:glutathione synthase/RimK-type ligase-like ATP-grasp enzyme
MKDLHLQYGAFDLIKSTDGYYYFLEVNSQGQWLWIEDLTGLKITQSIADWLIKNSIR